MTKKIKGAIAVAVILFVLLSMVIINKTGLIVDPEYGFISSEMPKITVYDEEGNETEIVRGTEVEFYEDSVKVINEIAGTKIVIDEMVYYTPYENICFHKSDIVKETELYVRTPSTLTTDGDVITGFADKGEKLEILTYEGLDEEGNVITYLVDNDGQESKIRAKYTVLNEEDSLKIFEEDKYYPMHEKAEDKYGGGDATKLDYYPNLKPEFEDNIMPEHCYSLYLNAEAVNPKTIKPFIDFAKETKINTFVLDIKDNFIIGYPAEAMKEYAPSAYKAAYNSYDEYKEAVKMLKDEGFYVVGRITVFKDDRYVKDHPENAISSKSNDEPFKYQGSYWPTPYSRDVWEYNVALARESVTEIGFNEINFDYCRFPDRIANVESSLDMKNKYGEDKAQAIQRFLMYATDTMHDLNAYVSVDVFGETSNGTYTTPYGQYWPAMSNVVDVMSGMPYPDHFGPGSYGLAKPWNEPYALMYSWGTYVAERQKECPTPAKVRTWIQAYNVLNWVDPNGIAYNADALKAEIRGLYDAGIGDGYITWNGGPSLSKYNLQKEAFMIDYAKE